MLCLLCLHKLLVKFRGLNISVFICVPRFTTKYIHTYIVGSCMFPLKSTQNEYIYTKELSYSILYMIYFAIHISNNCKCAKHLGNVGKCVSKPRYVIHCKENVLLTPHDPAPFPYHQTLYVYFL